MTKMTGEELRKFALTYFQTHPEYWKRWLEARSEWQQQELMLEVAAQYVARICVAEFEAAGKEATTAITKQFIL